MPKPNEIIIIYDADKLKAIRKFSADTDPSLELELQATAEKIYLRRVPAAVRVYLSDDAEPPAKLPRSRKPHLSEGGPHE
ncbi:hypothetical protein LJC32_03020 [Oscillospiraceae bacterium OttesenSCG-928-F05]|nr:hypothetical protein [Oscillospiraceae bacterium OttesenSCG-928-F05]